MHQFHYGSFILNNYFLKDSTSKFPKIVLSLHFFGFSINLLNWIFTFKQIRIKLKEKKTLYKLKKFETNFS
jgi:uncharacterized membrane protein YciS (DUF1049 family)